MSLILVFFTLFVWSSSFTFSKGALAVASPLFITGSRMLIAGIVLLGVGFFFRKNIFSGINRKSLFDIVLLSLTGFYLANVLEFHALPLISSSKASFIYGLSPFITAIISYIQLKEKTSRRKSLGILIGVVGYVFYLIHSAYNDPVASKVAGHSAFLPELLLIGATFLACYGWTLMRKIEKEYQVSPFGLNTVAMLVSGVITLIHSMITESWQPIPVTDIPIFLKMIGALVLFSNVICYNLYAYLLKIFSSTFLSFCGLVMPLFAALFGWFFLQENMPLSLLWGVGSMIVGCRLVYAEDLQLGYITKRARFKAGKPSQASTRE